MTTKVLKIAKAELQKMFYSPIAWISLIVFIVQCGYGFVGAVGYVDYYMEKQMSLSCLFLNDFGGIFTTLYNYIYLYVPLLTMGLISEELRNKNINLLYAAPVSNAQIILGKYLAILTYGLLLMGIVCIFIVFGAIAVQNFEWGVALSGLLGVFLMFVAYSAIGLFVSSLTSYPVVAAIGSFIVLGALSKEEAIPGLPDSASSGIQSLSKEEDDCMKILANLVTLTVNDKEGYITLSASMPEPVAAAQLAYKVQVLLQKYVTEFKIEKARANLEFIEERYADAKSEFERKQEELAEFRDANRNFASAVAKTTEERLSNEYAVVLGVYSELAKQREQANIQVKEDTPIFAVVEPVTVPTERSKPKRALICVAFTFLGGFCGVGLVLVLPFLAQVSGARRLRKWLPEATERGIS